MTSRGQEKGLQTYGALDCFGWRCGGRVESHPAFLPEYLYPVGFFADYGPKGVQANNKRSARQCEPLVVCPEESHLCFLADYGPKGVQGGERKATLLASIGDNFVVRNSPLVGPDASTPARGVGPVTFMGYSFTSEAIRRGAGGERKAPC